MSDAASRSGVLLSVPGRPRLVHVARWLPCLLIALAPAALLAPWFAVPLDRDEGANFAVAIGMRHGMIPYADLFDHKPPLIYGAYWLTTLAGGDVWQPRVLAAMSLGATGLLVMMAAREMAFPRWQAITAGAILSLSTSNILLQTNANTEAFMLLPMTASLWAALRGTKHGSAGWCFAAGALGASAILFKTTAAFSSAVPVAYILLAAGPRRLKAAGWFTAGGVSVLAASVGIFAAIGAVHAFWYANVTYNRLYTDAVPVSLRIHGLWYLRRDVMLGGLPFWLLAAAGGAVAAWRRQRSDWLMIAWAAGAYIGVKFTGRDNTHYYVQLLPPAALLGALAAGEIAPLFQHRPVRYALYAISAPLVTWHVLLYAAYVGSAKERATIHALTSYTCESATPAIGAWIREHSEPHDRIYNLGRDAAMYYYANRLPAAQFMYDRPFSLDPPTADQTATKLATASPRFIVDTFSQCTQGLPEPPLIAAVVAQQYHLVQTIGPASIYQLRDSTPVTSDTENR